MATSNFSWVVFKYLLCALHSQCKVTRYWYWVSYLLLSIVMQFHASGTGIYLIPLGITWLGKTWSWASGVKNNLYR